MKDKETAASKENGPPTTSSDRYSPGLHRKAHQRLVVYSNPGERSMTMQDHAGSVEINNIIRRFDRTGELPLGKGPGQYGDVSDYCGADYSDLVQMRQEALDRLREVDDELGAAKQARDQEQADREAARKNEVERAKQIAQTGTDQDQ